jgi:DNA-binding CsgD family transcriptional regulator
VFPCVDHGTYRCAMAAPRTWGFRGRARERWALDRLVNGVRGGESAVLVIRGEAGTGKTALLRYCARQAAGCRLVEIAGVESEMRLPFAALHQLCTPMLPGGLAALPEPQERAVRVAFGLAVGDPPDRFVLGLAVLSLLAEIAGERPLICLVDDAQWLDEASSQVLGFVGRRLVAEAVVLLLAVRESPDEHMFTGMPTLSVEGLLDEDARALLTAAVPGQLDERVRDRIVAETGGNPLGLLELARGMSEAELAGGFAGPPTGRLSGQLQSQLRNYYVRRVRELPRSTRLLMLLAATDPTGDATLLWRAGRTLGLGPDAATGADAEQLLTVGSQVRFRHPLVRSAAYAAGSADDRRATHMALAAATDAQVDPERRVWHLAAAATGPDEKIAGELERTAVMVQARAGLSAAAAFLQRSVALTAAPRQRADRALAAALANLQAGAFDAALGLLAEAEAAAVDDLQRARVEQLRGQIEHASSSGREAPVRLMRAAVRLESLDVRLARDTYLDALFAAFVAGGSAQPGGHVLDVVKAVRSLTPPPQAPLLRDHLLDGLATMILDGRAAAEPTLRRVVDGYLGGQVSADDWLQWGLLSSAAAIACWDFTSWALMSTRHLELARASGALARLSAALNAHRVMAIFCGDVESAASLGVEEVVVKEATGARKTSYGALLLAAYQGRPADALPLITATAGDASARGEGLGLQHTQWAAAIFYNGLARYAEALPAAEQATSDDQGPFVRVWALPELIEAAARTGNTERAADGLRRLSGTTVECSDWAKGIEARSRALLSAGNAAELCYVEALERLGHTELRLDLARAHLLYGEWLRRGHRRADARRQLRSAYDLFMASGAEAFAERARREMVATGEKVRKRLVDTRHELTPQEEHIAQLARDGQTNSEIGAELFLSARTVEWHLRKVFTKLGIASRKDLHGAVPSRGHLGESGAMMRQSPW